MSIGTKVYNLQAMTPTEFGNNSLYGSIDMNRMFIIDNTLAFVPQFVSDGVINGLQVSDISTTGNLEISVATGMAKIKNYCVPLFGSLTKLLDDNSTYYLFLQREQGFLGKTGNFSNLASLTYIDTTLPSIPTGLAVSSFTFNSISLQWNAIPDIDFSYYSISRSTDNITYTVIATNITALIYTDNTVNQNTLYYYKVESTDANGNQSGFSSPISQTTALDLTVPSPAQYLLAFPLDSSMQLSWAAPQQGSFDHYLITYQELDNSYNPIGPITSQTIASNINILQINYLINLQRYNFTIYTISLNSISSGPVSVISSPQPTIGPFEVETLTVNDTVSSINPFGVQLNISWSPYGSPYILASYYQVTLIENGSTISTPINVYNSNSILISSFTNSAYGTIQEIQPRTQYIVEVAGVDSNGIVGFNKIAYITTSNFLPPNQINALVANYNPGGNIIFSWNNSTSIFLNNYISLTVKDLSTNTTTTILSNFPYGINSTYVVQNANYNSLYTFSIYCKDEFNLVSPTNTISITVPAAPTTIPGQVPGLLMTSNDGCTFIEWTKVNLATTYFVWRATSLNGPFTLIDTLPASQISYYDYTISDSQVYFYFVTYENIYGVQSLNPVNNNYSNYSFTGTYSATDASFPPTTGLIVSASGQNAILNWTGAIGAFDGYEIYRSYNNTYSFNLIGYTSTYVNTFTDTNALIGDGIYYYLVRKYRNQVRLVTQSTLTPYPLFSIPLAKIVTSGAVSIENLSIQVANLKQNILDYTAKQIANYQNNLTPYYDHRIDLSENISINDWTTTDSINFKTTQYIQGATSYKVYLDGIPYYGLYEVDQVSQKITFPSAITVNVLTVIFIGLNEITNDLETGRISSFFASQVFNGVFQNNFLPELNHAGRINEVALPLKWRLESNNNFQFTIQKNSNSPNTEIIGTSLTFYDIINVGSSLVAGTSTGFIQSFDGGYTWNTLINTTYPVQKIVYLPIRNKYIALSGNLVLISDDGTGWAETYGLSNIDIARDVTEDNAGVIYISTDLGPYRLDNGPFGNSLFWQISSLNIADTTDCYAIYNESGTIYVSTILGLFETANGISWNYTSIMPEMGHIYGTLIYNNFIFAIKDNSVWRKVYGSGNFIKIADLDVQESRKIDIINGIIFTTTSNGFYYCPNQDIYNGVDLKFSQYDFVNYTNDFPDPTLLRNIDNILYLGSDKKLWYTLNGNVANPLYIQALGESPTLFKNNNRIRLGYFYNQDFIFTDTRLNDNDLLFVANTYSSFVAQNGGWIGQFFSGATTIYKNGNTIATFSPFPNPVGSIDAIVFPVPTEFNSNSSTASVLIQEFNAAVLLLNEANAGGVLPANQTLETLTANCVSLFYSVYSQFTGNILFTNPVTINGESIEIIGFEKLLTSSAATLFPENTLYNAIPMFLNNFTVDSITTGAIDSVSGIIDFNLTLDGAIIPDNLIDKYDTITLDIQSSVISNIGVNTHVQLENKFESVNSGLTYALANILTSNVIKSGIFIKQRFSQ